jgi:hypothetical protein
MCEPCGWMVTLLWHRAGWLERERKWLKPINYIYKTCLLHYLLLLVLFTQFNFHTSKNLHTLVKTLMLLSVYSSCNKHWHLILYCCLYLCETACLKLSLRWKISVVISYLSTGKTEIDLTDINCILLSHLFNIKYKLTDFGTVTIHGQCMNAVWGVMFLETSACSDL